MRDALNGDGELRHAKTCPSSLLPIGYIVEFETSDARSQTPVERH